MVDAIAVAVGGALGSLARWLVVGAVQARVARETTLPVGTLTVNVVGSALVAALLAAGIAAERLAAWRLFLVTGFAGGFTTYSAMNQELFELLRAGAWPRALLYSGLTLAGALGGGFLGSACGGAFTAARGSPSR